MAARALVFATSHTGRIKQTSVWRLTDGSVFEDLEIRRVNLKGDRFGQLLVVRSYPEVGASLFLVDIDSIDNPSPSGISSPPIGSANAWLNPIGAADFDGDGEIEIAAVVSPHSNGVLTLYRLKGSRLVPTPMLDDVSNHGIGTPDLRLHKIIDWNNDGVPDIAVPDQGRKVMRFITLKGGTARELDRVELGSEMIPPMVVRGGFKPVEVEVRLKDGRAVGVSR
jgi:hypothetical protein